MVRRHGTDSDQGTGGSHGSSRVGEGDGVTPDGP